MNASPTPSIVPSYIHSQTDGQLFLTLLTEPQLRYDQMEKLIGILHLRKPIHFNQMCDILSPHERMILLDAIFLLPPSSLQVVTLHCPYVTTSNKIYLLWQTIYSLQEISYQTQDEASLILIGHGLCILYRLLQDADIPLTSKNRIENEFQKPSMKKLVELYAQYYKQNSECTHGNVIARFAGLAQV
jgi:hypothetical protein